MKSCDLDLLNSVSEPTLHPDGSRCAVAVTRPDFAADAYVGQLWEVAVDGGAARRLSRGFRDTSPQYSPDGRLLGFLRAAAGAPAQLCIVEAMGGEPRVITNQKAGVSWFSWSPDSATIVFSSRVPQKGRYGTTEGVGAGAEDPRLITVKKYRMNGLGYTLDQYNHIFTVSVPDLDEEPYIKPVGRAAEKALDTDTDTATEDETPDEGYPEVRQLTTVDADHSEPVFSADGKRVLFASLPEGNADDTLLTLLYSMDCHGGDVRTLQTPSGIGCSRPVSSRDGRTLYFLGSNLGSSGLDFVARNTALYRMPTDGSESAQRLTDPRTSDLGEAGNIVVVDGGVLVFDRSRGTGSMLRVGDDGSVSVEVDGNRIVSGADACGDVVVVTYTDPDTVGDVARVDGGWKPLTDFSAQLRARTNVLVPMEQTYPSRDGYPVHGWVVLPEGEGPHPVLLNIHGGPYAQFGVGFFDEAQVYADAGYAVLLCNPRGAAGYGEDHGRVIQEAMGTVDLDDVLAFLEGALAAYPRLDNERLGVMGGSYGGYLTAWTISQDHRFTAAIVERGYLDPPSFVGSSDIGWFFSGAYTGTDPELVRSQNPFAHVDSVGTPALIIHSEEDLRCPVEQAQRYYTALKMNKIETELLLFPGENHELSRSGTPWHRRQRFEHILRWWARWLPTDRNSAADGALGEKQR